MKKLLLILLLIAGCSIEPLNDILGVVNQGGSGCSIWGYAKMTTMAYEDSLTILLSKFYDDAGPNTAKNNCENDYAGDENINLMADSLGIFNYCDCN